MALIELINEKPWPTDTAGIAWAKALIPHIQQVDGGIPVAVSIPLNDADPYAYWIGKLKSALAPVAPDVWDIHYYGLASLAKETFTSSKAVAAPQPLVIGETGKWTDGTDASERAQSSYLYDVSVGAAGANLPAPAPWILYDIRKVETFGLYRADGRAKPAAATMQWVFSNWRWPQTRSRTLQ